MTNTEYKKIEDWIRKRTTVTHGYLVRDFAYEDLLTFLKGLSEDTCKWKYDDIDNYHDTGCGEAHVFTEGSIKDNWYKFCPYCGKEIKNENI